MRKSILSIAVIFFVLSLILVSCKKQDKMEAKVAQDASEIAFDSTLVETFFSKYPKLIDYKSDVEKLYRKHQYHYVWYDKNGINEFGNLLYNKINNIEDEGIQAVVPYKKELDQVYDGFDDDKKPNIETELLNSSLYFFYADKVFHGLDAKKAAEIGWYLPHKKQSYVNYLDSLLVQSSLIHKDKKGVLAQYFLLKDALKKYREIEKSEKWETIVMDSTVKSIKPGDSSRTISQIRQRLYILGDISSDSKNGIYDKALVDGILKYKKRNAFNLESTILPKHIASLNVPIAKRIKTIIVNMERCRWISADINKAKELIVVNVPSYQLTFFRDGNPIFRSKVVVGKAMNKTVIFSAPMRYIVFSPYWNVPTSIINKEIKPEMAKNKNYLEEHNMEWNNGIVRQKPGLKNSLGLVKFLFPNSSSIYLHDTPAKGLFSQEKRAFSHGCIRVAKPIELANLILKEDKNWTPEKINTAMNSGKETWYTLKNKIPVYIGYFTAWVNPEGNIQFYDDIYDRDERLASMLLEK